ncbi:MAG: nucleotide-binding protein [Methylobacter sp.]|nr:nucleotide-binding protein [Methylobacter sp.]
MTRKKTSFFINEPLELLVKADEAGSKLTERIRKGKEIKSFQINSVQDLEDVKKAFSKWNDFNKELLKRLFSTEELSNEYGSWASVGFISLYERSLREKVTEFHEDVDKKIHRLDSIIDRIELIPLKSSLNLPSIPIESPKHLDRNKIFVVHGQNNEAKLEVARFIEKIGFEPIILHEQASGSKTIIEKIETYSDVGFGVVIYTPCDVGSKSSEPTELKGRARQNVVFEHGFLIGKLGRANVCPLVKGNLETPNDISGIVYTSMDTTNWQLELAKELRGAGYTVDMNKII